MKIRILSIYRFNFIFLHNNILLIGFDAYFAKYDLRVD